MGSKQLPKIRILHVIQWLEQGGAEKGACLLAASLNKDRYESIVCAFQDGLMRQYIEPLGVDLNIVEKKHKLDMVFLMKLVYLMKKKKVDLVHCRGIPPTVYGGMAAKLAGLPLVTSVHGRSQFQTKTGLKALYLIQKFGGKVVAVSESMRDDLVREGNLERDKIMVIHNGIDVKNIELGDGGQIKREEFKVDTSSLVIGAVGTLRPVKGYEYLVRAMPLILESLPQVRLVFIGDGESADELKEITEHLGLQDSVLFLGRRKYAQRLMNGFDVLAVSSLSEGLSMVILEAMSVSVPVVATKVGGNPEVVEDGVTGILVEKKSEVSLAQGLIWILKDENKRKAMGKAGWKRVKEAFSLKDMVRKYEEVYESLLS
ncbi:MAG: glycosyltransferase [bacterium]